MKKYLIYALTFVLTAGILTGCTAKVFNEPVTISMCSSVIEHAKPVAPVSVEYTNSMFVIIPIPADPRDGYDDLLAAAKAKGGNAVIDVQLNNKSFFMWMFPAIMTDTWELTGTVVRMD